MTYNLSDRAILRIFDLVQLGLITGTDIVDNLRTLKLSVEDNTLTVSEEEDENFKQNIKKLELAAAELLNSTKQG